MRRFNHKAPCAVKRAGILSKVPDLASDAYLYTNPACAWLCDLRSGRIICGYVRSCRFGANGVGNGIVLRSTSPEPICAASSQFVGPQRALDRAAWLKCGRRNRWTWRFCGNGTSRIRHAIHGQAASAECRVNLFWGEQPPFTPIGWWGAVIFDYVIGCVWLAVTTSARMAAHRKLDQRHDDPCAGGLCKRASCCGLSMTCASKMHVS